MTTSRKRGNKIYSLEREDGFVVYKGKEMEELSTSFFQNLFRSNGVSDATHLLTGILTCINSAMNQ